MGEVNPRLLAVILEDLQQELTRWATVASDTIATAAYTQRHAEEQVDQAHRHAAIVNDKAANDRDAVENLRGQVEVLFSKCVEARQLSHKALAETTTALQKAQKTLSLWQTEMEYALAWLARAEERVRRAEAELAAAEAELRRAESELSRAESAYRNCVNYRDDKGRRKDCSSEASRVRRAQEAVHAAVLRVKAAQLELAAAKAERERARARVKCCQTAVGIATKAVEFAQEAKERATMAVNASERSLETAQAAQRFMKQAVQKVTEEEEAADDMLQDVQLAANFTSEGQHHFRNTERFEESAQRLRIITRTELDNRIGILYELNRPDLGVGSMGVSGASSAGHTLVLSSDGSSRASNMLNKMIENRGKADLTLPGAWGRFTHNAIQDYILDHDPDAEVEKTVAVIKEDGSIGKGRIDAFTQGVILDVKTHNLDRFSVNELTKKLNAFATQIEGYQWSPDIKGKPDTAIFFEFRPQKQGRQEFVEAFYRTRGIGVIWGSE